MLVRMWRKRNTLPFLVELQAAKTTLEISLAVYQEIGHSPGHITEYAPTCNKDTCSTIFIAALFIIAKSWKEHKCSSTEEWIQKMWYIYTMEYYSAIKNSDFMKFASKWMELENMIFSEVTQSQKSTYGMYSMISRY